METYFNTTKESKNQTSLFCAVNAKQNELVLEIATSLNREFGASIILNNFPTNNVPITSIRRALNTLEHRGKICKTGFKQDGIYGRPENTYKVC